MFGRKLILAVCAAATAAVAFGQAPTQQPEPPKAATTTTATNAAATAASSAAEPEGGTPSYLTPETPKQRHERLGTDEDPGTNPDPAKHYWRFGKSYHIERFDRKWASYDDVEPGMVRPFAFLNLQKEVYQQNEKYVWVWLQDVSPEELQALMTPKPTSRYTDKQIQYFKNIRNEFFETAPKPTDVTMRFEESSEGLPTAGSWRNSGTIADMNGDGCPDIVAPPERAGGNFPAIFLGDCKGHWRYWSEAKWPKSVDYGNVVAADFNKDGHMDLAFGVHLTGVLVFLGDGKGNFTDASAGLPTSFPTRRVAVTDVDGDGWPDVVAISEGPGKRGDTEHVGRLRAFLNRDHGKRWEPVQVAPPDAGIGGDWMSVGHLTANSKGPDFVGSSIFYNSTQTIFLNEGAKIWKPYLDDQGTIVPYLSYYAASTMGKFSSKQHDDAIVSYIRFWPQDLDENIVPSPPAKSVVGLDRITFNGNKAQRTPIVRWGDNRALMAVATADFNHDGKADFIYTRYNPREAVLMLGDGKGGFTRAKVEGITLAPNTNYDIMVGDVNNDGLPDVVVMYESSGGTAFAARDGSIHVFLNRGVVSNGSGEARTAAK